MCKYANCLFEVTVELMFYTSFKLYMLFIYEKYWVKTWVDEIVGMIKGELDKGDDQ